MAQVDPFIITLPSKLAKDPQLGPFFNYLLKFLHDLWQRTGGGADNIAGTAKVADDNTFTGSNTFSSDVELDGADLTRDGTQILTARQAAVEDAAAATASDPAAITEYTPHSSGGTTVTSNAATDLDTTAAALDVLVDETQALEIQVSNLIADVADIRTKLNAALARLRAHGLIDT